MHNLSGAGTRMKEGTDPRQSLVVVDEERYEGSIRLCWYQEEGKRWVTRVWRDRTVLKE